MEYLHNKKLTAYAKILRKGMTAEECKLWYNFLKHYPVRFLRQKVLGFYIVDFYCSKAQLVIEVDGKEHFRSKGKEKDSVRTEYLEKRGLRILRFSNAEVQKNFQSVCEKIDRTVGESLHR